MNRIAGMMTFDQMPVAPFALECMVSTMKLREEEQSRLLTLNNVGFACISIGNQNETEDVYSPGVHPNGHWMIAFDGRIDNRRELLAALERQFCPRQDKVSDEEIVLGALEKWGLDFPKHLAGDFAIAIYDKLTHQLICVRDHFGVKPFYYLFSQSVFIFASSPFAILASRKSAPSINTDRIADFLVELSGKGLEGVDKRSSFYKDIYRLPPAHMLVVHQGNLALQRYWELQPDFPDPSYSESDLMGAFLELYEEAVRCRLENAQSASMLSGGMDSSSIVGIGRKISIKDGKPPLNVLTVVSNSPEINRETSSILSVLTLGNINPHLLSESFVLDRMDRMVNAIEMEVEPFDCLMNLSRAVYLQAYEQKTAGILDGIDGDVLLSGSGHLTFLWRKAAIRTILEETIYADGLTAEYKTGRQDLLHSLLSAFLPYAPAWLKKIRQPYRYGKAVPESVQNSIIDGAFATQSHLDDRFAMLDSFSDRPKTTNQFEYHKISLEHPFLTVGLERYERTASAFGIEALHPLLDVRLVKFCSGLPWQLKTRHGWNKYILRRTMEPFLPVDIVWRRDKENLMWVVNRLILSQNAEYFHQVTLDEREILKPYVDTQKLEKIWQEYFTQGDEKNAMLIWSGIALAFWLRRHRNMVRDLQPGW